MKKLLAIFCTIALAFYLFPTMSFAKADWDKSSLSFVNADGDCKEIYAVVKNGNESKAMAGTSTYEVYYVKSGNPKTGSVVSTGNIQALKSGETFKITFVPTQPGNYMFKAYQRPGHPGKGELWSEAILVPTDCNPSDKPGDNPSDNPGDNPGDKPSDNPGDKPGDNPGDKPGDNPGDKPSDNPGDKPGDKPGDNPGDKPGDNPGDKPGDNPGDKPGDKPGDNPGDKPGDNPGDKPGDKPNQPQGGPLPKTASSYPLGALIGFMVLVLGAFIQLKKKII